MGTENLRNAGPNSLKRGVITEKRKTRLTTVSLSVRTSEDIIKLPEATFNFGILAVHQQEFHTR